MASRNESLLILILAALVAVLAAGLRPDSFYSGDSGIKLIAARAAIATPTHPFDIPLPAIAGAPTPHVEPFLSVHGDHAHAVTSPLFPLLTAPLLAAFGLRGLYVLPALGYLLTVASCGKLASALDRRRRAFTTSLVAAIATPFLFYALEFWEHLPAVACATLALVLLLRARPFAAGLLFGLAIQFRPEAFWFGVAVCAASPALSSRLPWRSLFTAMAGALVSVAPYELYVAAHFGTVIPAHLGTNSGAIADGWLPGRWLLIRTWFMALDSTGFWSVAPCVAGALASLALSRDQSEGRFLWLVSSITIAATLLTAPNTGGGQWAPRYLLLAYVPLVVLAAGVVQQLPPRHTLTSATLLIAVLGCLWVQRSAYRELRGTKATYGRVVDFMTTQTMDSQYVVTDVWWLDQVAASALGEHAVLFAPEAETGTNIVGRLSAHAVPVVTVVRSETESTDTSSWRTGSCYVEEKRERISIRHLVLIQLRHQCLAP